MKNINTAIRFIAARLGLPGSVALGEEHPGTRSRLARWAAVLALAIALVPGAASAQEDGTITISGTFSMDYEFDMYYLAPELLPVYYNGYEHTWTLTLHGTTPSHSTNGSYYRTVIHETSFDLEFFGPDAATLNGIVSDHLAGGGVYVNLQNTYYENGGGLAIMQVWVDGNDGMYFYSGHDIGVDTLFPADADGYPIVEPEPFSIKPDYTELGYFDLLSGWYVAMGSLAGPVTFEVTPSLLRLSITHSNNLLVVSWPSPSTGFSLQQNNQLNPTNWVTPTETVTDTGTIKFITVDPSEGSRFYRLFKP